MFVGMALYEFKDDDCVVLIGEVILKRVRRLNVDDRLCVVVSLSIEAIVNKLDVVFICELLHSNAKRLGRVT